MDWTAKPCIPSQWHAIFGSSGRVFGVSPGVPLRVGRHRSSPLRRPANRPAVLCPSPLGRAVRSLRRRSLRCLSRHQILGCRSRLELQHATSNRARFRPRPGLGRLKRSMRGADRSGPRFGQHEGPRKDDNAGQNQRHGNPGYLPQQGADHGADQDRQHGRHPATGVRIAPAARCRS